MNWPFLRLWSLLKTLQAASTGWPGLFLKNAPRAHYMQNHTGPFCMAFLGWPLLGRRRLSGLTALTDMTRGVLV